MRVTPPPLTSIAMTVALVVLGAAAVRLSGPSDPAGDETSATAFAAERAMAHVRVLAQRPHPMGSAEHTRVCEYLVSELQKMGLKPERQRTTGLRLRSGGSRARGTVLAGLVENVMVRLPGTASTGAVLVASHYDSVSAGPGAADDGAAVAAILEALRALKAGEPLRNDIIALFTDGEEDGLLGAEAFVSRHPWARDVRVVLNFEARGNRGPVQMFETTPGNAAIVRSWAGTVAKPSGTSLGYEVYQRLPNDTDFTEFKRLNAVGLNFAFIDEVENYHTPNDTPAALDRGSVQGHGDAALSLARRFGSEHLDLAAWRTGDAVFFSLPGGFVVRYSAMWAIPLALAALAVWIGMLVRARRRGDASLGGTILAFVILAVLLAGQVWASLKVTGWLTAAQNTWNPVASPLTNGAYASTLACLAVAIWLTAYILLRAKFSAHSLALAAAFIVAGAGAAFAYTLPGASYLAAWPAVAAALAVAALPPVRGAGDVGWGRAAALLVLAAPAVGVLVPTATLLFSALGLSVEGAAGMVVLIGIAVACLLPQAEVLVQGRRWWAVVVLLLAGAGTFVAGVFTAPHGSSHPRPENLIYAMDANARRAVWATPSDPASPWLEQFVTADPKRGPLSGFAAVAGQAPFLSAPATAVELPGPAVVLERAIDEGGGRLLVVRVTSPRRARALSLRIPDREVLDTRVNGRQAGGRGNQQAWTPGRWGLEFSNVPPEGIEVVVRVRGSGPVTFVAADRSDGIPADQAAMRSARPPSSVPIHRGDMTLVQSMVTFK